MASIGWGISSQNMAVQYLQFRILKFPLKCASLNNIEDLDGVNIGLYGKIDDSLYNIMDLEYLKIRMILYLVNVTVNMSL